MKDLSNNRRNILNAGVASAAAMLLPATVLAAKKHNYGIVGKVAPELEISDWIDGSGKATSFKLSEHQGKFVFMEFWQSWCPGCHAHGFPTLKKISDVFKDNDHFTAIAIQTTFEGYTVNTSDKMREIQKRYDLDIIFGHDAGDPKSHGHPKTMVDYRSGGTPWAVLISPDRKVLFNDFQINAEGAIQLLHEEIKKLA